MDELTQCTEVLRGRKWDFPHVQNLVFTSFCWGQKPMERSQKIPCLGKPGWEQEWSGSKEFPSWPRWGSSQVFTALDAESVQLQSHIVLPGGQFLCCCPAPPQHSPPANTSGFIHYQQMPPVRALWRAETCWEEAGKRVPHTKLHWKQVTR